MHNRFTLVFTLSLIIAHSTATYGAPGALYYAAFEGISQADLDQPQPQFLVNPPGQSRGLAISTSLNKMVVVAAQPNVMTLSNLDGSGLQSIYTTNCGSSCTFGLDLAFDETESKIYWTESGSLPAHNRILRSNLDGTDIEDVLPFSTNLPSGIEIDFASQTFYWAERTTGFEAVIRQANFDGSQVKDLITVDVAPSVLEMDFDAGKMYWNESLDGEIWRANLDGSQPELLVSGLTSVHALQLDTVNGRMYWSDFQAGVIGRSLLDGSNPETFLNVSPFRVQGLALAVIPEPATAIPLLALGLAVRRRTRR